jgi:hypothetical protein
VLMLETVDYRGRVPIRLARQLVHEFAWCDVAPACSMPPGTATAPVPVPVPVIEHPEQVDAPVRLIWGARDTLATRGQMDRSSVPFSASRSSSSEERGRLPAA